MYRTVASTEVSLGAAGVAPGVSTSRILSILDSLGAEHSGVGSDGTVGARLGRSFEEFMIHGDILVTFRFDSAGRLTSHTVHEVLTGP